MLMDWLIDTNGKLMYKFLKNYYAIAKDYENHMDELYHAMNFITNVYVFTDLEDPKDNIPNFAGEIVKRYEEMEREIAFLKAAPKELRDKIIDLAYDEVHAEERCKTKRSDALGFIYNSYLRMQDVDMDDLWTYLFFEVANFAQRIFIYWGMGEFQLDEE